VAFSALVGRDGGRYVAEIVVGPPPPRQDGRDSRAAADASATSAEMTIRGEDFIVEVSSHTSDQSTSCSEVKFRSGRFSL
jgi:hypothetical protein